MQEIADIALRLNHRSPLTFAEFEQLVPKLREHVNDLRSHHDQLKHFLSPIVRRGYEAKGEPKGKSEVKTNGKSKDRLDFEGDDGTYFLQAKGEPKGKSKGKSKGEPKDKSMMSLTSCCPCM